MSDLESFSVPESTSQGSSAESFRLFQERMKQAAAQIKAIKAGEQKQKKKEDELIRVLSDFIKSHQSGSENADFLFHISKLLSFNCPAAFILGILLLNFPELQAKTGFAMTTFEDAIKAGALEGTTLPDIYLKEKILTPAMKIAIDSWVRELSDIASDTRHKLLQNCLTAPDTFHPAISEFMTFSLLQYLSLFQVTMDRQGVSDFCQFCLAAILENIKKDLKELN